jgi:hypothetical protein
MFGNVSVLLGMGAVIAYASQLGFNFASVPVMHAAGFPAGIYDIYITYMRSMFMLPLSRFQSSVVF